MQRIKQNLLHERAPPTLVQYDKSTETIRDKLTRAKNKTKDSLIIMHERAPPTLVLNNYMLKNSI